ncbi:MAG: hypothetical protein H8E15_11005 [Planctomycetes bacterium]|nr:hypothetical protein [Planctomycetota bacterium]
MVRLPIMKIIGLSVVAVGLALAVSVWTTSDGRLRYSEKWPSLVGTQRLQVSPGQDPDDLSGPLNEWAFKWVKDVNSDSTPDLVFATKVRSTWLAAKRGADDWVWHLKVYSGKDGKLLDQRTWGDAGVRILSVLGSNGTIESIRFFVDGPAGTGTQSLAEDFVASPVRSEYAHEMEPTWQEGLDGLFASPIRHFQDREPKFLVVKLDDMIPLATLPIPARRIGFTPVFFPEIQSKERGAFIAYLMETETESSVEDSLGFDIALHELPRGKLESQITLQTSAEFSGEVEKILAWKDVNSDSVNDWLVEYIEREDPQNRFWNYAWLDGKSGQLLIEDSASWSRTSTEWATHDHPSNAATNAGLFEVLPPLTDLRPRVSFRQWSSEKTDWILQLQISDDFGDGSLHVTEFPDLNGDAFPDFGIVAQTFIGGNKTIFFTYAMPDIPTQALLVSGATGLPLLGAQTEK